MKGKVAAKLALRRSRLGAWGAGVSSRTCWNAARTKGGWERQNPNDWTSAHGGKCNYSLKGMLRFITTVCITSTRDKRRAKGWRGTCRKSCAGGELETWGWDPKDQY
eukprot:3753288-Pyramimonas_sp.AAC.2